jgi:hypothetical protein
MLSEEAASITARMVLIIGGLAKIVIYVFQYSQGESTIRGYVIRNMQFCC